jgi:preprotein translocase subunit SecA
VNGRGLEYEHQSLAGADAIAAAGGTTAGTATMAMTGGATTTAGGPRQIVKSDKENIGRNDPCWCGSGKKFKKCHGA